jgi:hypothetical protein
MKYLKLDESTLKNFKNYIKENYIDELENNSQEEEFGDDKPKYGDDIIEFNIPEWALSALINGDMSGNSDEDIEKINAFVAKTVEQFGNANFMLADDEDRDLGFCHRNDIDNLGSNCEKLLLRATKGL